jgi:hypothetical protein
MLTLLLFLSMAFGKVETPATERKPWNVDSIETSSNQQNIVLPYFAGVNKCPADWITDGQHWTSRNVDPQGGGKGGKGGSGGQSSQKKWYCDIAAVTNFCPDDAPNDALLVALVNGEVASSGPLYRSPGSHYVSFSLAKFCPACRFYWGTKDQPLDTLVISHITGEMHSAYRNQGLFVAKQWFTGSSPNVQSIVLILARGSKFFASRFEAGESGVNPMGVPFEIFTDPAIGFGLPSSRLVESSFQDVADACDAEGLLLTPALTQARSGRAFLAEACQYTDGWFRRSDGDKIEAGLFTHGDIDVEALPEVGSNDIIGEAEITHGDAADTTNAVWITYTNREKAYKPDDTERIIDYENYLQRGLIADDRLDRKWILDGPTALKHGTLWARVHSKLKHTGPLNVRRDRIEALGLRQGDRFKTNSDSLSLSHVWRIMRRESPSDRSGVFKLTLENERGIGPLQFVPDPAPGPPGFIIVPSAIEKARIVELPSGLKTSSGIQVQVLWQRPSTFTIGARIHLSLDGGDYQLAYVQQHFAAYGQMAVAYPNGTADLDTSLGLVVDLSGEDMNILNSQTDPERDDYRLLAWCNNEIFSVGQVTALGSDRFRIFNRRALYGTAKANHFVGAEVFFIYRAWLEPIDHAMFVAGATRYFKLQPFIIGSDLDLDAVDPIAYNFSGGAVSPIFNLQLTTSAQVIAGHAESRIAASWDYALDQDIATFDVAIKRTTDPETAWQTRSSGASAFTDWVVQPNTPYLVKVRGVNSLGEPGAWCTPQEILSASISPFSITGLELEGQGNDTEAHGPDFNFACRLNSPGTPGNPGGAGVNDPNFDHFLWRILVGDQVIYEEPTTAPRFQFTYAKNVAASALAGLSGSQPIITDETFAVDRQGNQSAPGILPVRNSNPVAPGNLDAFAAQNRTVLLSWTNGSEPDLRSIEVYRGTSANPEEATKIATIPALNDVFVDSLPNATGNVTWNYWLKAVDTFGLKSPFSVGASATSEPGPAPIPDIEDLELQMSLIYRNVVILRGASLAANTPDAGSIAWNAHRVVHNGVLTDIAEGNTALKYVYWNIGENAYVESDTQLSLGETRFLILQNASGIPRPLWNFFANAVIGNASILDASIVDAHIRNCSVDKLISGTILAAQIILRNSGLLPCIIRSYDYDPGLAGLALGMGEDGVSFFEVYQGLYRGRLSVGGSDIETAPFRVNELGDAYARNMTIEDALFINTLVAPVFVNLLDSSNPVFDRSYTDNDDLSLSITAPAGKKVRFEIGTTKRVSTNSPYWPNAANDGDGVGPDDFLGFVFNYVAGNSHNRISSITRAATQVGSFLSDEVQIQLTYTPVAGIGLPAAPEPVISFRGGTRGSSGYEVNIDSLIAGAALFWSIDGGTTYTLEASGSTRLTLNTDDSVMAYITAPGYAPSGVVVFYNTGRNGTDPGWNGPPGTDPP